MITEGKSLVGIYCNEREESVVSQHDDKETDPMIHRKPQIHETYTKVTYTKGSPEWDGNYDKPEFVQPQEETLMSIVWN